MGQRFFGLTSEHKVDLHKTLFALVYFSNGAFTFNEVYSMPIYLRNFYIKQLEETKKQETEELKKVAKGSGKPSKR